MEPAKTQLYRFGRFEMDASERSLRLDGRPVSLEPKAFDLLLLLVTRAGHLVEKEEIMGAVWPDTFVEEGNLTRNISLLRRVLAEGLVGKSIETVPKHGYRFLSKVSVNNGGEIELLAEKHTLTRIVSEEVEDSEPWEAHPVTQRTQPINTARRSGVSRWVRVVTGAALLLIAAVLGLRHYFNSQMQSERTRQTFQAMNVRRFTTSGNVLHAAISPDGKYVATVVDENGLQSLWVRQVAANTSAVRLVPPAFVEYWGLTFSNDSNFIFYVTWVRNESNAEIYELPALGGTARKLPLTLDSPISFSPAGDRFTFVTSSSSTGESYIQVADLSGKILETLAKRPEPEFFALYPGGPAWSPDGNLVAYAAGSTANSGEQMHVFVVSVQSKKERPLSQQSWKDIGRVTWLGDGSGVVFSARDEKDASRQLWCVSFPEGTARKITNDLDDYSSISLTTDAKTLVAIQTHEKTSISVASAQSDAANATEIFSEVGAGRERLTWMPDSRILFSSRASGNWDIWSINKDGTGPKQLTLDPHNDLFPAISPDGRTLFFASDRAGVFNIWRMQTNGDDPRQLTQGGMQTLPEVTADGDWVVYTENIIVEPRVWRVPAAGGQAQRLTSSLTQRPICSPDGKQLAYVYLDDKAWGIAVRPLAGAGEPVKKYPFPAIVASRVFRWSPDGHSLAYIAAENGVSNLWLQPLDGGPAKQLTNFKSGELMSFAWSPDGQWSAYMHHTATRDVVLVKNFK
ncbi:MAG TPA: winged helix-turn-helix domain-containing protein [Pyrinomonadaceae bacterium]